MLLVCRHDVRPDGQLYSSLMDVAGQAKRVDLAFDLQADMVAQGLQPSGVRSFLISAMSKYGYITSDLCSFGLCYGLLASQLNRVCMFGYWVQWSFTSLAPSWIMR